MARLNIEERCFGEGRLFQLGQALGGDEGLALGRLGFLWHDSQELCKTSGTQKQILMWCRERDVSKHGVLFEALLELEYVTPLGPDLFKIHGNHEQIESRLSSMKKAKKGGRATYEKWKKLKAGLEVEQPGNENSEIEKVVEEKSPITEVGDQKTEESRKVESRLEACPKPRLEAQQYNTRQCNAIQGNAMQIKNKNCRPTPDGEGAESQETFLPPVASSKKPPGPPKETTPTWKVWQAYLEVYKARYPKGDPKWSSSAGGQVSNLIKLLGFDDALLAVRHYLTLNDKYFVQNYHPIGLKNTDWHRISESRKQGKTITGDQARQMERDGGNRAAISTYYERKYGSGSEPGQGGSNP